MFLLNLMCYLYVNFLRPSLIPQAGLEPLLLLSLSQRDRI